MANRSLGSCSSARQPPGISVFHTPNHWTGQAGQSHARLLPYRASCRNEEEARPWGSRRCRQGPERRLHGAPPYFSLRREFAEAAKVKARMTNKMPPKGREQLKSRVRVVCRPTRSWFTLLFMSHNVNYVNFNYGERPANRLGCQDFQLEGRRRLDVKHGLSQWVKVPGQDGPAAHHCQDILAPGSGGGARDRGPCVLSRARWSWFRRPGLVHGTVGAAARLWRPFSSFGQG